MTAPFAVCFIGNSYPIPASSFTQAGPTQYVLDIVTTVTPQFWDLKEVTLFLTAPNVLDPTMGLGLYIRVGSGEWQYRGCVHSSHPSESMPLVWPDLPQGPVTPGMVQVGISVEPAAELAAKEGAKMGAREDYAKRVAYNLFRFMESFGGARADNNLVVPMNILDMWFRRFQDKFRRDPDFLARQDMPA